MATDPMAPIDDPEVLSQLRMWDRTVYGELLACRAGRLSEAAFTARHQYTAAILALDATGFTRDAIGRGDLHSLLRILDLHRVCLPILRAHGAQHARAFADNLCGIFAAPERALACALEIHRRVAALHAGSAGEPAPPRCSIGLGYGPVLRIGPDRAMGGEMNRASKLGEDIARGGETLVTDAFHAAAGHLPGYRFEPRTHPAAGFPFFEVTPQG